MKIRITALLLLSFLFLLSGCQYIENRAELSTFVSETAQTETTVYSEATSVTTMEMPLITTTKTTEGTSEATYIEAVDAENTDEKIRISFVGDTTQSGLFGDATDSSGIEYAFSEVKPIFDSCDISFANLETCVSTRGKSEKSEGYGFRSAPDKLEVYDYAGIDVVSVANNHVRDFGMDALNDTFLFLEQYGIEYVGAGRSSSEARSIKTLETNGFTVGFVAYNMIMHNSTWYATDERAGMAGLDKSTEKGILEEIKVYDEQCDILIVSMHWGLEYVNEALNEQKSLAHRLSDSGADMIIGHHPHVLEPVEMYNGTPIFYSIGNFLFYKMNDEAGESAVFTAEFDKNGFVGAKMYPALISYCRAKLLPAEDEAYSRILTRVNNISMPYGTRVSNDGDITFGHTHESPPITTAAEPIDAEQE